MLRTLPGELNRNPVGLAVIEYQLKIAQAQRPTVSSTSDFFGVPWPGFPSAYVSHTRAGGERVPVYPSAAARGGKTQGAIKSEGVGTGGGSRYRSDDRQLGARAGGLFSDWVGQKPGLSARNMIARLTSSFRYAERQFERRPVVTPQLRAFLHDALKRRGEAYLQDVANRIKGKP